jgi:hypothetical protein
MADYQRNLSKEIAGYFLVILCALPIRFWIMITMEEQGGFWAFLAGRSYGFITIGLISAVFVSKLRLRTKLVLTFLLVAI